MHKFEFEVLGMGMNPGNYPGAFTKPVEDIIKSVLYGKVLHLYSGSSLIGDTRVDLEHPNATTHCRVEDFVRDDTNKWDWMLLDPPYAITRRKKLDKYAETASLSADVKWRNEIKDYFRRHTANILWLDYCAPMINGFRRRKLWLLLPGGYHNVRVLSWLEKSMDLLL
jgi:16S rRNA G966 N2-methylase RsmD